MFGGPGLSKQLEVVSIQIVFRCQQEFMYSLLSIAQKPSALVITNSNTAPLTKPCNKGFQ